MTFIFNEDKALKSHLTGIKVSDAKNAERPVGVWFGQPDIEIREQSYPYLTIDLVDVEEDTVRAHRGIIQLDYIPEGLDSEVPPIVDYPIPVNLYYQISSYSRNPHHDRQIIAALLSGRLSYRFNYLIIPEDGTARRIDFLGFSKRDTVESDKRLLVNTFSISMPSELIPGIEIEINPVETVNTTYTTLVQEIFTNH